MTVLGPLRASSLVLLAAVSLPAETITTIFPLTENPISQGGLWINGGTVGLEWGNVETTGGFAGGGTPDVCNYCDPTAILAGSWGPDQTAEATVYSVGASDDYFQEVELRLDTTISADWISGYEINFRTPDNGDAYVQIVRWNGPEGDFTDLNGVGGIGVKNGDVVEATIDANGDIDAYINGVLVLSANDTTYASGAPGIGFDGGCDNTYSAFGFTSFSATDGLPETPEPYSVILLMSGGALVAGLRWKWRAWPSFISLIRALLQCA